MSLEKAKSKLEKQSGKSTLKGESSLLKILLQGTLLYVFFSVFISLFIENTLFWTLLNTAGVAAWTMHRIAMRNRKNLPFRVWLKSIWYGITGSNFNKEDSIERSQWQLLQEYHVEKYENPFTFDRKAWLSVLVPIFGSIPLQVLYFSGLGEPVDVSLLLTWIISNVLITLLFAAFGSGIMRTLLYFKEKGDREEYKAHKQKTDTRWIDRLITTIVLLVYISLHVLPATLPVSAAPDCSKKKQDVDTFFECYDSEIKYQPHTEPIVPPIPGYNMPVGQAQAEENYTLPYYETPEPELNLFQAAWKGITGMGKDIAGIVQRDGSKALSYLASNMNNPQKLYTDARNTIQVMTQAHNEGIKERANLKKDSAMGIVDWLGNKFQSYMSNPIQAAKNDIQWMDKNIVQPTISHTNNVSKYIQQNPQESWKATNIVAAPFFHIKVAIESNYPGGTKQLTQDAATILADKETYWSIAKSPFSERTQQLFEEGKYAQATGRANGELSVEAAQEGGETLLTGGFGKAGMIIFGFAIDTSQTMRRTVKIADEVGDHSKLPKKFLPDITVPNSKYSVEADTSQFNEGALQHIFDGDAKEVGNRVSIGGFHHELNSKFGQVKPGTEVLDKKGNGVYQGEVEVFGYDKTSSSNSKSTFFPKKWSREDVVNGINKSYQPGNKTLDSNGRSIYEGTYKDVRITVIVDNSTGKIITSYPNWPQ